MNDLAKFDPAESRIAAVKADPIVADVLARLPDLIAAEEVGPIKEALKLVVPLRTDAGRVKDELKRQAIDWNKAVDERHRSIVDRIRDEMETPLQNARMDIEKAEWRRAEVKAEEDRRKERERVAAVEAENARLKAELAKTEVIPQPAPRPTPGSEFGATADMIGGPSDYNYAAVVAWARNEANAESRRREHAPPQSVSINTASWWTIDQFGDELAQFMRERSPVLTGPAAVWFNVNVRMPMLAIHASCVNKTGGRPQ